MTVLELFLVLCIFALLRADADRYLMRMPEAKRWAVRIVATAMALALMAFVFFWAVLIDLAYDWFIWLIS